MNLLFPPPQDWIRFGAVRINNSVEAAMEGERASVRE